MKQQSRTSALMVTAKRAQLLLASIYRAGGSAGVGGVWRRVTQSLGQLGGRGMAKQRRPRQARPARAAPAATPEGRAPPRPPPQDSLPQLPRGHVTGVTGRGAAEKKRGVLWPRSQSQELNLPRICSNLIRRLGHRQPSHASVL